jgi:hypothetical protein
MMIQLKTKELAQKVVELIAKKERAGLDEAMALLNSHYPGRPREVARAYEIACLVVVKKLRDQGKHLKEVIITPDADWLAIRAAQSIQEGNLGQGFSLLRIANNSGAQRGLCRSVVTEILRNLELSERVTELHYTPTTVVTIEVGRVSGAGLVILRNTPSKRTIPDWQAGTRVQEDSGSVFLRNIAEVAADSEQGWVKYEKVGTVSAALSRINWSEYIDKLSIKSAVPPKIEIPQAA